MDNESLISDPPSYKSYESPTSLASKSQASSKYLSIMEYLEQESEELTLSNDRDHVKQNQCYISDDDVSSMSLSPSVSSNYKNNRNSPFISSQDRNHLRSSAKKYVWDEDDVSTSATSVSSVTISRNSSCTSKTSKESSLLVDKYQNGIKEFKKNHKENGSNMSISNLSNSSLGSAVDELKRKIEMMKDQLYNKAEQAKELHMELVRINTAKKRREEKVKHNYELKLRDVREEQSSTIKKQHDFMVRIGEDVKQLVDKKNALKEKCDNFEVEKETQLVKVKEEARRKLHRAKRQWEADETLAFNKICTGKLDAMKKQAAESFGPKIDKMVIEGKEKLRDRIEEGERSRLQLSRELGLDLEARLSALREAQRAELEAVRERVAGQTLQQTAEARQRGRAAEQQLRARHEGRRRELEEGYERGRRAEESLWRERIAELRRGESRQLADEEARQQAALAMEMDRLEKQRVAAAAARQEQEGEREQQRKRRLQRQRELGQAERQRRSQERLKARAERAAAEVERVCCRLRLEAEEERDAKRQAMEAERLELRAEYQQRQSAWAASEQSVASRSAGLRQEVATLRQDGQHQRTQALQLQLRKEEKTQQLAALRTEAAEAAVAVIDAQRRLGEQQAWQEEEEEGCSDTEEQEQEQEQRAAAEEAEAEEKYRAQLLRVQSKIAQLLARRTSMRKELEQQLQSQRLRVSELEQVLETVRSAQFG